MDRIESTNAERPQIYRYHEYREFLRDWLWFRRYSESGFTMRKLADKAGLASGYLPMILSGSRELSAKALTKLLPHLGLNQTERSYLEQLVILATTDSQDARADALTRMKRFGSFQRLNPKELEVSDYLTHWYYPAIREMTALPDFKLDAKWIQARLQSNVPLAEIKAAIEFLTKNKYIEVSADGSIQHPEKSLDCIGGVYRVSLAQFHREMLALASQSIENMPSSERLIMGHTVALTQEQFEKAKEIVNEAVAKITGLTKENESKKSNEVYQVELSLFPLTRSN